MSKFRLFAAIFAFTLLAGCADVAPTAPQDEAAEFGGGFGGFLGGGG